MSLRTRLMLLMTGMVGVLALFLLTIQINGLISVWLSHTFERATSTAQFIKSTVMQRAQERTASVSPAPKDLAGRIVLWRAAIATDAELPALLSSTVAQTKSIVEIVVAGERGHIIACSNPGRTGGIIAPREPLSSLLDLGPLDRLLAILGGRIDYEYRIHLGVPGNKEPVFVIQVLVSSVLLRDSILPELRKTALASFPLFVLSVLIAWLAASLALRPLTGISQTIDRIASGETETEAAPLSSTRELAAVQEKLRMLGEQFRGAQVGATQLRGSVERLLERLEEAIFLFNAAGKLMVCSEQAERLLHLKRSAVLGHSAEELFPQTQPLGARIANALLLKRSLRETQVGRLTVNLDFLPDGAVLLRLRDAESREIIENQLNVSSRLASINRLTGGVAHEIKNPLNSIALRLELLRSRVLPEVPQAEAEIEVIAQEITRLDRVVRTFLDFTRPVEVRTMELDLATIAGELVELVRPEAQRAGVSIETAGLEASAPVQGDTDLLKQALMNILKNALEAMPKGGKLGVALREEDGVATLEISDTGPGVPAAVREKIFQLYYSTKQKGTGIGLAMAYRAVQLHNGSIEVDEGENGGALFRLRFPAAPDGGGE